MLLQTSLTSPGIGMIFWTTITFLLLLLLLRKFAWGPVMKAVKSREDMIRNALESAERAREDMKALQADNEIILRQAREERDKILRDARVAYERMMSEAKEKSQSESDAMVRRTRELLEREKQAALSEVKREVARLAIEVASRVVGERLKSDSEQQKLIERYINEIEANRN